MSKRNQEIKSVSDKKYHTPTRNWYFQADIFQLVFLVLTEDRSAEKFQRAAV